MLFARHSHEIGPVHGLGSDIFWSRHRRPDRAAETRIAQCGPDVYPDDLYEVDGHSFDLRTIGDERIMDFGEPRYDANALAAVLPLARAARMMPIFGRWLAWCLMEMARPKRGEGGVPSREA